MLQFSCLGIKILDQFGIFVDPLLNSDIYKIETSKQQISWKFYCKAALRFKKI